MPLGKVIKEAGETVRELGRQQPLVAMVLLAVLVLQLTNVWLSAQARAHLTDEIFTILAQCVSVEKGPTPPAR